VATTALDLPQTDIIDMPAARTNTSLVTVVWQRKSLVILGIVIGLVLGALYYAQSTPIYQSGAKLLVVKRSAQAPSSSAAGSSVQTLMMEDYMSTQSVILQSQIIADRAANGAAVKAKLEGEGLRAFPGVISRKNSWVRSWAA